MDNQNNRPEENRDISSGFSSDKKEENNVKDETTKASSAKKTDQIKDKIVNNTPVVRNIAAMNRFRKQLKQAKEQGVNPLKSLFPKVPFLSGKGLNPFGSKKKENETDNEEQQNTSSSEKNPQKQELSSNNPIDMWGELPPMVKIAIISVAVFMLIIFIIIVITLDLSTKRDDRTTQQAYISGKMSEDDLCHELRQNGFVKSDQDCEDSNAYKFYTKIKDTIEGYKKDKKVSLIPGVIYETISYDRLDEETYNSYIDAEIEDLADALVEEVEETCYTYESGTDDEGNVFCNKKKVKWTYNQISFSKYISYLKYGKTSTHPNYQNKKPRQIENESCQGPIDDTLCGKQKGSDSGSKKTVSTITLNSGCPSPAAAVRYPYNACSSYSSTNHKKSNIDAKGIRKDIVEYALSFVGNRYIWGGTDPNIGADCSGFVQYVYKHFGYEISRTTYTQINDGKHISEEELQPGDLIFYNGHVVMYTGPNEEIVHASSPSRGIVTDPTYNYGNQILAFVNIIGD